MDMRYTPSCQHTHKEEKMRICINDEAYMPIALYDSGSANWHKGFVKGGIMSSILIIVIPKKKKATTYAYVVRN